MTHSYFSVKDRCLDCGRMQEVSTPTQIESEAGTNHWAGAAIEVTLVDMQFSHQVVRAPEAGESWRILEEWVCRHCHEHQWMEVVIGEGAVRSIEIVRFDPATLDRVHFVTEQIADFYRDATGESYYIDQDIRPDWKVRPDWKDRLRPHLR